MRDNPDPEWQPPTSNRGGASESARPQMARSPGHSVTTTRDPRDSGDPRDDDGDATRLWRTDTCDLRAAPAHSSRLFMMATHSSIALFEQRLERSGPKTPLHDEFVRKPRGRALPGPRGRDYGYALGRATVILALCAAVAPPVVLWSLEVRAHAAARSPPGAAGDSPFEEAAPPGPTSEVDPVARATPSPPASGAAAAAADDDDGDGDGASARESESDAGAAPGAALHALACLEGEGGNDSDGARRGVQKRDFIKRHRVELSLLGGHYAADMLSSTYTYGAAVVFWLSEDFGVEALLARNPVEFRLEQPFTGFDREHHFQSGMAWNAVGAMVWAPIHAKLRWSERRITHADLSWVVGAGRTFNDTAQGLTLQVGVGLRLFLARYLSIRLDLRDFAIPEEVLGRGRTSHNIVTLVGLCGWFPG